MNDKLERIEICNCPSCGRFPTQAVKVPVGGDGGIEGSRIEYRPVEGCAGYLSPHCKRTDPHCCRCDKCGQAVTDEDVAQEWRDWSEKLLTDDCVSSAGALATPGRYDIAMPSDDKLGQTIRAFIHLERDPYNRQLLEMVANRVDQLTTKPSAGTLDSALSDYEREIEERGGR